MDAETLSKRAAIAIYLHCSPFIKLNSINGDDDKTCSFCLHFTCWYFAAFVCVCVYLHAARCSSHCCCCCFFGGLWWFTWWGVSLAICIWFYIWRLIVWLILWLAYYALCYLIHAFIFSETVRWMWSCTCEWASSKCICSNGRVYNFVHPSRLCRHHTHTSYWIERALSETKHI